MKIDPTTRRGRFLLWVAAWLVRALVGLLGTTMRLRVDDPEGRIGEMAAGDAGPMVVSFWHDRAILAGWAMRKAFSRRGVPLVLLVSQSRDGELVDRVARLWGLERERGSATRGGTAGLRRVYRRMTKEKASPVMIPDGPRGPQYHFKVGVAVLAQMAQAPVLPVGLAVDRCWKIRSWDRLRLPKPFSTVALVVGPPTTVERGLDEAAMEAARQRLEAAVNGVTAEAEGRVGGRFP